MALPIVAALAGGAMSMIGANRAASAQRRSADQQIAYSEETRDQIRGDLAPYRQGGQQAQNALMFETGLGPRPEGYGGYQQSPGYDFRLGEGVNALDMSAAASGDLFSGRTGKAITQFGQDFATNDYNNYLNRLSGLAGSGQNAAAASGTALTNNNAMVNQALGAQGNAQAAGAVGMGNAFNQGLGNAVGAYQYQQANQYQGSPQMQNALSNITQGIR